MDINDYTTWITAKTNIYGGAVMSIDSTIPTEMTNNATEWIHSIPSVENK